jgi:hypothetical protein
MKLLDNKLSAYGLLLLIAVYAVLMCISLNFCYFGDNILQVSKEAHWFYLNNFKYLLTPAASSGSELAGTGYHPPMDGICTALLWKIFGYHLWISHALSFVCFLILLYNLLRLAYYFLPENTAVWATALILLEPTVMAQFAVASPDFILLTACIVSFRTLICNNKIGLGIAFFFLCSISMRGLFTGIALFMAHNVFLFIRYKKKEIGKDELLKWQIPYLPAFVLLAGYFAWYFMHRGWFFSGDDINGHYSRPRSLIFIVKHFLSYGLRSIENGRIFIWITAVYVLFRMRFKVTTNLQTGILILFFIILSLLYFLFVFISQMPFSGRYFMPQFAILTLLTLIFAHKLFSAKKIKIILIFTLIFEVTGHLWIYPEKTAVAWDCSLAHIPYYELRHKCFKYIDDQGIDYSNISGGFCLYGNRKYTELGLSDKRIGDTSDRLYYIYSNITNEPDSLIDALSDTTRWRNMKTFEQWPVHIILYRKK